MDAYYDANIYNDIERGDISPEDVAALKAARARGAITPYLSFADIEEFVGGVWEANKELARSRLRIAQEHVGFEGLLKPPSVLLTEAIQAYVSGASIPARTLGRHDRRFHAKVLREVAAGNTTYNPQMSQIAADVKKLKEDGLAGMKEARDKSRAELMAKYTQRELSGVSFSEFFADGATSWAEHFAEPIGLADACRERGLDGLLQVGAVRLCVGMAMSVVHSQVVQQREPKFPDAYDLWHAVLASVGDIFLTRDKRFADHLDQIPDVNGFRVLRTVPELLMSLPRSS